jgi:hypothetical protein
MGHFTVTTKLWPTGASLDPDTGIDDNIVTVVPPNTVFFDRQAAPFVTSPDGTQNFQFLFWNTGRNVTNKRYVHWVFTLGNWSTWAATRWYGVPPQNGGGLSHEVSVSPFSIANNEPITNGTAIDASASTFPAGAYPDMGDDHLIDTQNGAVNVAAKPTLASQQFAGWDQLVWGGDDSDTFNEYDSMTTQGSPGFYPAGSGSFPVAQNCSAILLALYGNSTKPKFIKEGLKAEIDVLAKSRISDIPKLKNAIPEGDWRHGYSVDPEWIGALQLIAQHSDQLQQQVAELQSFIRTRERPQVGVAVARAAPQQAHKDEKP